MSGVSYRVTGAEAVIRAFARLRAATAELTGVRTFADEALSTAQSVVKIDTGALRGTIAVEDGPAGVLLLVAGDSGSPQAGVLNYGDPGRIAGDQFLTGPATDVNALAGRVEDDLARTIRSTT